MRTYDGLFELRPTMIGTLSAIGGTAIGAPVDCLGFKDVLAIVTAGALVGSAGANTTVTIKFQESAQADGTGALWSDITNGAVNGSMKFSAITHSGIDAGTWAQYQAQKLYERLDDNNRSRYIRAHATVSGTVGHGAKLSVACLLGRPDDTLYINGATSFGSVNPQLTKML